MAWTVFLVCCTLLMTQHVVTGLNFDTSNYKIITDPIERDYNYFAQKCNGKLRSKLLFQIIMIVNVHIQ